MNKTELEASYLDTTYSVFIGKVKYDCRIGEAIPAAVKKLLEKEQTAAILTAWNPRSQVLDSEENNNRNKQLLSELQNNYSVLNALGQGTDNNWPAEESFFIIGLSKEQAEQLAFQFEQNAYVWFEADKAVSLEFSRIWFETI